MSAPIFFFLRWRGEAAGCLSLAFVEVLPDVVAGPEVFDLSSCLVVVQKMLPRELLRILQHGVLPHGASSFGLFSAIFFNMI